MRILLVGAESPAIAEIRPELKSHLSSGLVEVPDVDSCAEALSRSRWDAVFIDLETFEGREVEEMGELVLKAPFATFVAFALDASIPDAVEAMHTGFDEFLSLPLKPGRLPRVLAKADRDGRSKRKQSDLEYSQQRSQVPLQFESEDENVMQVFEMAGRVAPTDATVLILGESGTGKSVLSRALHQGSQRSNEPMVTVHCPSLSKELLESELFGHRKGAFTGAVSDKRGKVAEADGGTLFLDEIGELPLELQPKLLRLLQDRAYERVGDTETQHADIRLVSATNRDLQEEVNQGNFREDLFYRLNVITLEMPALRERKNDLVPLSESYVQFFAQKMGRKLTGLSPSGMAAIRAYDWPGNLRELRNVIERAVILCEGEELKPGDLGLKDPDEFSMEGWGYPDTWTLEQVERDHIERVMKACSSVEEAAMTLGVNPSTLYRKRKEYDLG